MNLKFAENIEYTDTALIQTERLNEKRTTRDNKADDGKLANRHTRLLEVLPAGVVVIDGAGIVQEANAVAVDLLGEPLHGERWISVIQRAFQPRPGDGHDVSLADGRMVNLSTSPLGSEPGQIIVLNDVTDNRALQDKVLQMQRLSAMGEVTAGLAHQIRTPLSSAILSLDPLLKQNDEIQQRCATRVKDSLMHMEQLIKDLLAFSRGNMVDPEPVLVSTLLEKSADQFRTKINIEQCQFSVMNNGGDFSIYGSQAALVSAINNLLNNAFQACDADADIQLTSDIVEVKGKQYVDICIHDNGQGIASDEQQKVIAPFYTTRSNGTGLGLAVVQSITKSHYGELWLKSQLGKGSVFGLRLPVKPLSELATKADQVAEVK